MDPNSLPRRFSQKLGDEYSHRFSDGPLNLSGSRMVAG